MYLVFFGGDLRPVGLPKVLGRVALLRVVARRVLVRLSVDGVEPCFLAFSLAPSLDRVRKTPAAPTTTIPPIQVRAIIVGEPADWTSSSKPFWPPSIIRGGLG